MRQIRKSVSGSVALGLVLTTMLAGCGSGNEDSNSNAAANSGSNNSKNAATTDNAGSTNANASTNSNANKTAAAADLDPVELNWYLPGTPQKDTAAVEQALDDYLKDKINATIKINFVDWGSWNDKFPVLLASGDNADIMFTAGWSQYALSVSKGYFADITDLLPQYAPKTIENLPSTLFEGAKINGKVYAVPTSKELAHTHGFLYSVDLAKKLGVYDDLHAFQDKLPTFAELEPILKKAKEADPNVYPLGVADYAALYTDFDPVGDQNIPGVLYPNKDTKVIDQFESPEYMETLKLMHKYYQAGYIRKDAATVKDQGPDVKAQKTLLVTGTTKPLANEEVGSSYGFPMEQFSVTTPFITSNDAQGSMNAVVASSKNKERALMFLELVNTDPFVNNTLNYGVEGTHYVKKSDNVIAFANGLTAQTSGYNPNAFWEFGNQFLNYFMDGQNTSKWEKFKEYNDAGVPSKILGLNFDAEPVKTEIAAVANVGAEMWPALSSGTVDPEVYLPKMVDKMKAAGLDKVLAEKQKQIDEWLKATGK